MDKEEKLKLLTNWLKDLDESSLDELIEEFGLNN